MKAPAWRAAEAVVVSTLPYSARALALAHEARPDEAGFLDGARERGRVLADHSSGTGLADHDHVRPMIGDRTRAERAHSRFADVLLFRAQVAS